MDLDEEQIVKNAINGDANAFGLLVQRHYDTVFRLAFQFLKNPTNAEDVTQDVFVEAFQNLKYLKEPSKFGAWIKGITFNLCKMWIRRYKNLITIGEMDFLRIL